MSKSPIDQQSWKPWQLRELNQWDLNSPAIPSLDDLPEPDKPKVPCLEPQEVLEQINLLDNLKEEAQRSGYQQGHELGQKEGYQAGFEQGLRAGEEQGRQQALAQEQPIIETWQKLLSEFNYSIDSFDTVITTKLLQIALTAAKQVLGQSTICDGTALLEEISHLLQQKPIFSGQPELHVNPAHIELIEQHLGSLLSLNGWRLVADPKLHLGGCRVVAEDGETDMTVATRWQELCRLYAPETLS
ncbi:flagellar assembly protein FliH [Providencia manganoxydans]|uniref:Flagellar assembly protein FliH n=1 Tax=Providencia manganoxydans TaxID=2923283 RepID=A0ABX7ABC3_9GAMM|nr:flagellar assembly protein FliH [Providencia manganoxydans]MDX4947261.1 flagellar assembly protein FliH [Providencia manganoxydans]QQO61145.1 flagellar assembly protein FliH [Providencia manganoxydans]HEF8771260.1 flagellar assembly protein FliH [Providencia stuartii]